MTYAETRRTEMLEQREHKGWAIRFDPPPIPYRDFDWIAVHPDYDAWEEDGEYASNGKIVHAATHDALIAEIDEWEDDNAST
jgi:hypothetical protein